MISSSLRTLEGLGASGSSALISSTVARRRRYRLSMIWLSRRVRSMLFGFRMGLRGQARIISPLANIFAVDAGVNRAIEDAPSRLRHRHRHARERDAENRPVERARQHLSHVPPLIYGAK